MELYTFVFYPQVFYVDRIGKIKMTKLLIIRHGYSVTNKAKIFTGQNDVDLAPEGYGQAEAVCRYIAENYKVDAIYSSDLKRAVNTILPLAKKLGLEIHTEKGIRELDVGEWQGRPVEDVRLENLEKLKAYRYDPANHGCPGGENYTDMCKRALPVFERIAKENDGKTVAVATHGGVIRIMTCIFRSLPLVEVKDIPHCPNASLMVVSFDDGKFTIEKESFNSYLEDQVTEKGLN